VPRMAVRPPATGERPAVERAGWRVMYSYVRPHRAALADRIIVLDAGQVKAAGTHAELVASDALYAELAATQFLATADAV
jgi:hypothetical protein